MSEESAKKIVELLEKQLALSLHLSGSTQGQIAKSLGKSKTWVNAFLKSISRESARERD